MSAPAARTARPKLSLIAWIAALALLLLLTVSAATTSGAGGLLIMLGLAALVAGVVATVRGRLPTLRLASRRAGLLMAASGLAMTMVGGAISPTVAKTEATGAVTRVTSKPISSAVACEMRPPATGEILVRSVTTDDPTTVIRLGGGWVWNWGDKKCITSVQFAIDANPSMAGFCPGCARLDQRRLQRGRYPGTPIEEGHRLNRLLLTFAVGLEGRNVVTPSSRAGGTFAEITAHL